MNGSPDIEVIDGSTFELRPQNRNPTRKQWICLRKNREFTNRYLELAKEFHDCRLVEVGVDQGGSTAFFFKLFKPRKMLAIELSSAPVQSILRFLSKHDTEKRAEIHWGVDQSDRISIPRLLGSAFGEDALDLVVDDASHLLGPSSATFEMLFPRLRAGGLYILEDWSSDHLVEKGLVEALTNNPNDKLSKRFRSELRDNPNHRRPMSVLIGQLVMAVGRNPDWISEIRLTDGFCEVRRGPARIPRDTPISAYMGILGSWIFQESPNQKSRDGLRLFTRFTEKFRNHD